MLAPSTPTDATDSEATPAYDNPFAGSSSSVDVDVNIDIDIDVGQDSTAGAESVTELALLDFGNEPTATAPMLPLSGPDTPASGAGSGSATGAAAGAAAGAPAVQGAPPGGYAPYHIKYYTPYFDVTTAQFAKRCASALLPVATLGPGDLYGAFWVPATLVFVMAVTTNIASYVAAAEAGTADAWTYDFHQVVAALSLVFGYVATLPAIVGGVAYWYDAPLTFVRIYAVFGYAMLSLIPACVACMIPHETIRWAVVAGAFVPSAACIARNLWSASALRALVGAIVVIHAGLFVVLKLYFFHYATI